MWIQSSFYKNSISMRKLKKKLKTKFINGFKISRGTFNYKMCPKHFLRHIKTKKTWNFLKFIQKWPFLTFAALVANYWNKNDCKLDKNLTNFFLFIKKKYYEYFNILMSEVGHFMHRRSLLLKRHCMLWSVCVLNVIKLG